MILYSLRGQYPQELPDRIILSDGFSRTGGIYTPEEIADAGYFPVEVPDYDPTIYQLGWNGLEFTLELIPPPTPTPNWLEFSRLMLINPEFNQFYNQLFTVSPLVAGSLQVALSQVASLGQSESFALIWGLISPNIPPGYREQWIMYAQENHLPADFIEILLS
ncbi:hypothetical protein AVV41_gp046 [Microcystis phage MaMV-DC]|uniref:Uncharacterized protein n=1 Tax=Microcystis phage MaMV-DC TaxID=1357715 RepID=A0A075BS04_9CAUD|nr:hypothetical protein AVV41_gp046 [Microcystis phage MaMV-DC]AGR48611.1 hypothetical protein MaMVDC_46 [Microcystis phage MaMV-DC]